MSVNNVNRANRAVKQMVDYVRDTVVQNVVSAISSGQLRGIDAATADVDALVKTIKSSVDQAYGQSFRAVEKSIADVASGYPPEYPAKKKGY